MLAVKTPGLPETIYLQCYDESGSLLDFVRDDVTWCKDQINDNDAVYILATPELAALLGRLAGYAYSTFEYNFASSCKGYPDDAYSEDEEAARELATRIRDRLD